MNRRDVLKRTGALALGLPAISTSGMINRAFAQLPVNKDLIVTVAGPFCYWLLDGAVKVMAPPVGTDYYHAAHQAWMGTSTNETMLASTSSANPPEYVLGIKPFPVVPPAAALPLISGTPAFAYEQGTPPGKNPLFNLILPYPERVIGVRPTDVTILKCPDSVQTSGLLAAGLTLYYPNVDLNQVMVTVGGVQYFQPCFNNDKDLPCATLGIHLTQLNQRPDKYHHHARHVWDQMLAMYPWMQDEIKGIKFNPFDPAQCPPEPASKGPAKAPPGKALYGPGNDCEVPIMVLSPTGTSGARKKKC